MAARVLILTPGQIGSNPRVVKEADALHAAGFDVRVLATRTLAIVDERDSALMARVAWPLERIDLRARSARSRYKLPQLAARRLYSLTKSSFLAVRAFSAFTPALASRALVEKADLYIAHYPAALAVAAAAARRHGTRYAYDAEDFHPGDWPDEPRYDLERRALAHIEARYLPGCAYVTAASPGIADAYAATYGLLRPTVVLNTFPCHRGPQAPKRSGTVQPGPSIYWFSQSIGPDRGIECAVRALSLAATRPHLYLRGTPVAGYVERLNALAEECGVSGRVHLLPAAAPDDLERLAADYDVGLCGEPGHIERYGLALTNKLFSYLTAGIPPLLSSTPAQEAFASEAGLGDLVYPVDDAAALATLMDWVLGSPDRLAAFRKYAFDLARSHYNWEMEAAAFLGAVELALPVAAELAGRQSRDERSCLAKGPEVL